MKKRTAILLASAIYIFWGLTPIYWKLLKHVPPFELLANRIIFGFLFVFPMFLTANRRRELKRIVLDRKASLQIIVAALLIGFNWHLFVLAVVTERVLEASLAYFLTPLMVVAAGVVLLKEKLNRAQMGSLLLAASGMIFLLFWLGTPPWLALLLSSTFAVYGYFKSRVAASGAIGVGIENAILSLPAVAYLYHIAPIYDYHTWMLLVLSGPLTIVPMIAYAKVVKAIPFSTVGFLQYLSPVFQFFLALIVYHETFDMPHQIAFGFTWAALLVFTIDLVRRLRKPKPNP
ncbi:MAG: EamA family transporter RarD [Deltaproteobacteria bacterium]|nr:EamA family transporter RarD [Deltaproteobacteria bacterium]MBI3294913.1 EamA family transporter RarD [Deltaproteobacteria bacterium]